MNKARLLELLKNPELLKQRLQTLPLRITRGLRAAHFEFLNRIGQRYTIVQMRGDKLWIDLHDSVLCRHFFLFREYEPYETYLLESVIEPGMTVVDIGANIGYYTVKFAKGVSTAGRVYAFEPDANNMALLKRNLTLNHIDNVTCEQAAVMDKEGELDLYLSDVNFGDHRSFESNEVALNAGFTRRSTKIRALALDDYLNGTKVDLIKMDIQGAEVIALSGMLQTLSNPDIILFCEFWPYGILESGSSYEEFLDILYGMGFSLYEIDETAHVVKPFSRQTVSILIEASRISSSTHTNLICTRTNRVEHFQIKAVS